MRLSATPTYTSSTGATMQGNDYTTQIKQIYQQVGLPAPEGWQIDSWNAELNSGMNLTEVQSLIAGTAVGTFAGAITSANFAPGATHASVAAAAAADAAAQQNAAKYMSTNYSAAPIGLTVPSVVPISAPPPAPSHNRIPSPHVPPVPTQGGPVGIPSVPAQPSPVVNHPVAQGGPIGIPPEPSAPVINPVSGSAMPASSVTAPVSAGVSQQAYVPTTGQPSPVVETLATDNAPPSTEAQTVAVPGAQVSPWKIGLALAALYFLTK